MRKNKKLLGALAIAGVLAASGSAFTASNSLPASATAGYGSVSISGVTAYSLTYATNPAGDTIVDVLLELNGDTTGKTIKIAFNADSPSTCSGAGVYDSGTDRTSYDCGVEQAVSSATNFVLVAV